MAVDDWAALAMRPGLEDQAEEEDEEEWEGEDAKEEEEEDNDGDDDDNDDDDDDDDSYEAQHERRRNQIRRTKPRTPWILKVVIPNGDSNYDTASVYVDPNMTAERLGQSIFQAISSDWHRSVPEDRTSNILVGLFANDRVFYSLECILAMKSMDAEKRLFSITKPIKKRKVIAPPQDHMSRNLYVAAIVLFLSILVFYRRFWSNLIHSIVSIVPTDLPSMWLMISYFCDWPARELYRYGPSAIGWEGRDMIDICTLMNRRFFNGLGGGRSEFDDRDYWNRNMETCDTMYRMKEESFVRMCRPIWYLTLMSLCFVIVQRVLMVASYRDREKPKTNPTDRAVLKTYYALQNLFGEHQKQEQRRQQVGRPKSGR